MSKHIDSIMEVVGLLRGSGKPLEDEEIVAVLLVSLPESYSGLVTALEGRQEEDLTVEYVTGKMLDEYQRRTENMETDEKNPEVALQSAVAVSNKGNNKNYPNKIEKGKRNIKRDNKENRTCFFCNKLGHIKADCRFYKKTQQQKSTDTESGKVSATAKLGVQNDHVTFSVCEEAKTIRTGKWCVDSGATSHMTNDPTFFSELQDTATTVFLADGSSVKAAGIGNGRLVCKISANTFQNIELKDVLYVPQLDGGLVSAHKVTERKGRIIFEENNCIIYIGRRVVIKAESDGSLFKIITAETEASTRLASATKCIHLWHRRLGHRDPEAIKRLVKEELATGIKISNCSDKIACEHCIKGKLAQLKFPVSKHREKEPMRLVHSDLCGPMQTATPSGNRYFLTLIDDYSRFTVVRLLKSKDEVPDAIKDYIAVMSTRFGKKPMILRTDNGKEYMSLEMSDYLRKEGIQHQLTVVYTPQQNGVAERRNRSLTESAKCMLLDAGLDNRFWGEAVLTATYLQNRMIGRSVNKTPVELFTGEMPDISHIRIFGSKAYSLVPKQKRRKWDDKAEEGVLVGYDGNTKGYRILNPNTDRVWISRSVRIIENETSHSSTNWTLPSKTTDLIKEIPDPVYEDNASRSDLEETEELENYTSYQEYATPSQNTPEEPARRVSQRENKGIPPKKLTYKVQAVTIKEPTSWTEMLELPLQERQRWISAAEEEMKSLNEHQVWELTDLPPDKRAITCKWVFKCKLDEEGRIHNYKARLVTRGFSQCYGKDYDETFTPVVKHETIRILLGIAANKGLHVRHLDVKSAYLNSDLEEEIFLEQPPGFQKHGQESKVLKLHKSIYGLKQSARAWNKKATEALAQIGFIQGKADQCLYTRKEKNGTTTYVLLYVDDILVAGTSTKSTKEVGKNLQKYFKVKDLGNVKHYLGMQIEQEEDGSFLISQKMKITKILEEYGLLEPRPVATPMETGFLKTDKDCSTKLPNNSQYRQAIGSLLYIAMVSRPDIAMAVGNLCRYVEEPTEREWKAVKRVIRYLASTIDKKLRLSSNDKLKLECFVDSDWAGDKNDRKSTSDYVFRLGKQTSVAMSSSEAEYIAASHASKELLWCRQLLKDMNISAHDPIIINEDNQGCICLIESDRNGARTKHIDVSYHHIRDLREKRIIEMRYCSSDDMLADLLTKPLAKERFLKLISLIGIY